MQFMAALQASNEATVTLTPGARLELEPSKPQPTEDAPQQVALPPPASAQVPQAGQARRPEGRPHVRHTVVPGQAMTAAADGGNLAVTQSMPEEGSDKPATQAAKL